MDYQLVFIPFPVVSHLVSAVETAKLLVEQDHYLSVTVLVLKLAALDTKIDEAIKTPLNDRVKFIEIMENDPDRIQEITKLPKKVMHRFIQSQTDHVRTLVGELMKNQEGIRVAGLVLDMFCTCMIDVAKEFQIPGFLFFTSGAAVLGLLFHLQSVSYDQNKDLAECDLDSHISIPTYVHPVPVKVFPYNILEKNNDFLNYPKRVRETNGILVNTFFEFESHAIQALKGDEGIPPIYPVGPVLQFQGEEIGTNNVKQAEVIAWLDNQPSSSVIFLCFGSTGCFEEDQVKEIAIALEQSGQRFLWSLRKPPPKDKKEFPGDYVNLDEVLPDGFLERTSGTGKIIGWAAQMAILSHPAIGGFVSHCGWNSTLESVWCGVPMAVWPLAAEQQVNAFMLVKELGIAVEIQMDYKMNNNVLVEAKKIENAIRQLMDPENGFRDRVKVLQDRSRMVLEGGSSYDSLAHFLKDVRQRGFEVETGGFVCDGR